MPFLLSIPGITDAGMKTDALVELIDIYPTLTELTGLPKPELCPPMSQVCQYLVCVSSTRQISLQCTKRVLTLTSSCTFCSLGKGDDSQWPQGPHEVPVFVLSVIPECNDLRGRG